MTNAYPLMFVVIGCNGNLDAVYWNLLLILSELNHVGVIDVGNKFLERAAATSSRNFDNNWQHLIIYTIM